jgi:outer membrane protein OmpA-like peptidoglycan-associated protein
VAVAYAWSRRSRRARRLERTRRGILLGGLVALVLLFSAGVLVQVPRIQADLADRVDAVLRAEGVDADVEFLGQAGRIVCRTPLQSPSDVLRVASAVRGVRSVELSPACSEPFVPPTTVPPSTVPPSTMSSSTTSVPETSTTVAPTTVPAVEPVLQALLTDGVMTLRGAVASRAQRAQLLEVVGAVLASDNVVDELAVESAVGPPDDVLSRFALLAQAMVVPLSSGRTGWTPEGLEVQGVFTDEAARSSFQAAVTAIGATATLVEREGAAVDDVQSVENAMNMLVTANPVLFAKGDVTIEDASFGTLQRVAGLAKRWGALRIEVQGHTDSEGDPELNRQLSERRAQAVLEALVAMGVPRSELRAVGYGETQPIVDQNGAEIPERSRRVVFAVTVMP